jgi:anti-sigma regulatory factor (Ser/Thr protein kinase)
VIRAGLELRIEEGLAGFEKAYLDFRAFLDEHAENGQLAYDAELAFEELVTNVLKYGGGDTVIEVRAEAGDDGLILTVEDDGPPFDPLEHPDPPAPASLEDAAVGGLGLKLVRMAARRIDYERRGGRTRVVVHLGAP